MAGNYRISVGGVTLETNYEVFFGVKGLLTRTDGRVLIVRESAIYRDGTELGKWDVVGGRIDPTESLYDGLRREIKEESGLDVEIGKVLGITENFIEIRGEACHIIRAYFACAVVGNASVTLSCDHDAYEWIDPATHKDWNLMSDLHGIFDDFLLQSRHADTI